MDLARVPTPAAVVDLDVLERNCVSMAHRAHDLGVRLRPHVKTHKCVEAGRLQVRSHFGGVTVSTVAEARGFIAGGFQDLTYAFPLAPSRVDEVANLAEQVDHLAVLVDQAETVDALDRHGACFDVFLKVDCGTRRAGVDPKADVAIQLARRLYDAPAIRFRGILTHAGHSYAADNPAAIVPIAEAERAVMVEFAERLRRVDIEVPEISVGSTPTCRVVENLAGVSEIRPGNYAFFDSFQRAIGTCRVDDIAQSVLATVVAVYPARGEWIIDAGALALSKDPGATHLEGEWGYGVLRGEDGSALSEVHDLRLSSLSQEHGLVRSSGDFDPGVLSVGDRVRVLPNHSCLTAAQFETFHVVRGLEIVDEWKPIRGW